jgi:hypothetical protein
MKKLIKMVAINYSTGNNEEISKSYIVPERLGEKTYKRFEDLELNLLDRLKLVDCDDYGLEYQYKNNIFYTFADLADYLRRERY